MVSQFEGRALEGLIPEARARLESLLAKGWSLPGGHALAGLHNQRLGPYHVIALLGPKNNVGSRYFQLFLADAEGRLAGEPLALGLHNSGPFPAYNWVELIRYEPRLTFGPSTPLRTGPSALRPGSGQASLRTGERTVDLAGDDLDLPLLRMLSALVPAGGHLMVEYDSPSQKASERALTLGYPPVTSPLGFLLFRVGCRSFRDWYIAEGGREGPRKLQGFKPLNEEIAREKTAALRRQMEELLARPDDGHHGEWGALARRLAGEVLRALGRQLI